MCDDDIAHALGRLLGSGDEIWIRLVARMVDPHRKVRREPIAEELGITRAAVEGRRTRLMKKIGLVSVVSLVRFAIEVERDLDIRETVQNSVV